jgi:RNAse (barnase) inhibitor barstar
MTSAQFYMINFESLWEVVCQQSKLPCIIVSHHIDEFIAATVQLRLLDRWIEIETRKKLLDL